MGSSSGTNSGGGGNRNTTCFVLLIVLVITTVLVLYAATGKISHQTSLPQHAVENNTNTNEEHTGISEDFFPARSFRLGA